jgi:type VI secretion system ImpH/TssG family protein
MPLEFTNYVYQRSHNHYDHTWRRFLDIINHRFTVFFYRAFSQNEQAISFDRSEDDAIAGIVKSFAGLPPKLAFDKKQERLALTYTRHIGSAVKNRWGLEAMLRHLFGFPLEVNDFVIASYDIPQTFRARLGNAETATLGVNLQIGRRYFSITQRFEIKIGPIMFDDYQIIMSGLSGFDLLAQAVNLYLDRPLDYHLIFTLLSNTIPKARLGFDWSDDAADGNDGASNDAAQLGYSGWLGRPSGTETTLTIDASRLNRLRHKDSYKRGVKVE